MSLHDTGNRTTFETGAVRDMGGGKGRFDLLPLDIIGERLDDNVLILINKYIREGRTNSLWKALSFFVEIRYSRCVESMLLEVAKQYEDGAKKYSDRNWEKGQPIHCYISSAISHYLKYQRGDDDEPHDRAFVWNILAAIWTHKHLPQMIDLPFNDSVYKNQIGML